ncbi:MAG: flavodoxin domain-containing protein [Candidatus Bathyarchaeia archaeon]
MPKALIVYGTRYGAAARTAGDIAETLRREGLNVEMFDLKKAQVADISEYELVIVGSGIQIKKWTSEPQKFLKKFQKELAKKKVALFVCCGSAAPIDDKVDKAKSIADAKRKYLEEKAAEYHLQPVALGLFGGIYNFNKTPWLFGRFMQAIKPQLEKAAVPQTEPGIYDTRDLNAIRNWAKELAQIARLSV